MARQMFVTVAQLCIQQAVERIRDRSKLAKRCTSNKAQRSFTYRQTGSRFPFFYEIHTSLFWLRLLSWCVGLFCCGLNRSAKCAASNGNVEPVEWTNVVCVRRTIKETSTRLSFYSLLRPASINLRTFVVATIVVGVDRLLRFNERGRWPLICIEYNDRFRHQNDRLHVQCPYM